MRFLNACKILCVVLFVLAACRPNAVAQTYPLVVHAKSGAQLFQVERAVTPEESARGLMFRSELAADRGMLFLFTDEQDRSFWMKNTMIPLDIIFIRRDGVIAHIHKMAKPYDETAIPSTEPVQAVLEIAGGQADKRGIAPGDRIDTDLLKQEQL